MRENRIPPKEEQLFLQQYNAGKYERPSVTADILVFSMIDDKLHVLLIKRKNYPFKDYWAFPGGFVNINESIEDAAHRELKEETGVENVYLEQLYTFSKVDRDPRMRVISTAYIALVPSNEIKLLPGDDASEAKWMKVHDLLLELENKDLLAFDHEVILKTAMERLQGKIYYTNVAFQLVAEEFTIRELRIVFEEILRKKLHASNFRRDMLPRLLSTGKYVKETTRPAELYKENKEYFKTL